MRQKLIDLIARRAAKLTEAENALAAGDMTAYQAAMTQIDNMNAEIQQIQDFLAEQDRQFMAQSGPSAAEARDIAEERGNILAQGGEVKFTADELRRGLRNQITVATGSIVQPTGAGSQIHDPVGNVVSSIVDRVRVINLEGLSGYQEPYVISELQANAGKIEELAGAARAESNGPTLGVAEIKPYEINTTSYIDRNLARLSPANYYQKVWEMALRAMRRKLADLIVNGDGGATPVFFGIKNAKNKAGADIFATVNLPAMGADVLDELYFSYGSDEAIGAAARLLLTKPNLKALGKIRGTNEFQRVFKVTAETGNANSGTIQDGGLILPYDLANSVGNADLLYGDPQNFEVGLFGDFTVRVDESVKAVERMNTILGDAMVGGNLIVDKGFVVGKVGGAAAG